jgi:hypothetical protein
MVVMRNILDATDMVGVRRIERRFPDGRSDRQISFVWLETVLIVNKMVSLPGSLQSFASLRRACA